MQKLFVAYSLLPISKLLSAFFSKTKSYKSCRHRISQQHKDTALWQHPYGPDGFHRSDQVHKQKLIRFPQSMQRDFRGSNITVIPLLF